MYFEVGISRLPHPARVEESGTFVEFRKSAHSDQASVLTVLVTPTPCMTLGRHEWLYQENATVPAGLYKTSCKRRRDIANRDLVMHSSQKKREAHYRARKTRRLLPLQPELTLSKDTGCDSWTRAEIPGFDGLFRHWLYVMQRHNLADAAVFGHQGKAPVGHYGYVWSRHAPVTLERLQNHFQLGLWNPPHGNTMSSTPMVPKE